MRVRLLIVALLLAGLAGCSSLAAQLNLDPTTGIIPTGNNGQIQLLFSNPNYEIEAMQRDELYGQKDRNQTVHGGIGLMGTWRF